MTTFLPSIVPSSFGNQFDHKPYNFNDSLSRSLPATDSSTASLGNDFVKRARQISPASSCSIRSAPLSFNNENKSPPLQQTGQRSLSQRVKPLHQTRNASAPVSSMRTPVLTPPARRPITPAQLDNTTKSGPGNTRKRDRSESEDVVRHVLVELQKPAYGPDPPNPSPRVRKILPNLTEQRHARIEPSIGSQSSMRGKSLNGLQYSSDSTCGMSHNFPTNNTSDQGQQARPKKLSLSPISPIHFKHRRSRLSDASSAFVHTVKTASLSNASFGAPPRSPRLGQSSDNPGYARFSVDSGRPATTSSLDEAAFHRGVKRHQIIREIVSTEESYLADIRALVYLYMTLLASTSAFSNQLRDSIQRNVTDLLHLHETLVDELHRIQCKAANRKWADTASPRRLGFSRHLRFRSLEPNLVSRSLRMHRHTRSSLEYDEISQAFFRLQSSDPVEAADVARIYKVCLSQFFAAYEEYSAKYEIIVLELNHHVPRWSGFETGLEALNKSLTAIVSRDQDDRKAMAVKDLLVKPIQKICKYPLLFDDLLRNTPVSDCPSAYGEIESTLQYFTDLVQEVNRAADSQTARQQIHRRWLMHERLNFQDDVLQASQFRSLGYTQLCGVLHAAWHSKARVDGCYSLCILFDTYFVLAMPAGSTGKFNITAVIHQSDLKIDSTNDGRGLQCHTALFTWKLSFEVDGQLYEILLSACSAIEEDQWVRYLQKKCLTDCRPVPTAVSPDLNLKPAGIIFSQASTLTRRLSIQRAATVGNRSSICQVIVRNTANPQDLQDFRQPSINRSKSHSTSHRVVVLAPKRSERARLESTLANIWTKDTLPYPGMVASRGGQIIRASAGSLVRKLSLASLHGPFTRRSSSLTLAHRKSYEAFLDARKELGTTPSPTPVFEIKKDSHDELTEMEEANDSQIPGNRHDGGERTMENHSKRSSISGTESIFRRGTNRGRKAVNLDVPIGPEDSANEFYVSAEKVVVGEKLSSKKRWSNPIGLLKNLSADGIRHMLYSSR